MARSVMSAADMTLHANFTGTYGATIVGRRIGLRLVRRHHGEFLAVYERDPDEHESRTRQLIFESPRRSVWLTTFPDDWHQMSDDQLVALSLA